MFRNYFIVAFRNFWRNKIFSLINILGLSIGISASLVIFLIVYYEFSYDRFEPGKDRIYRVVLDASFGGVPGHSAAIPAPLGLSIDREITGVEQAASFFTFPGDGSAKVAIADKNPDKPVIYKNQKQVVFTNTQYFNIVPYSWITGTAAASMKHPNAVVLTESRAHQYFPGLPMNAIMGKEIAYNDNIRVTVSGIVKDLNENTSFDGQEFVSLPTVEKNTYLKDQFMFDIWDDWMAYSNLYVKLSEGTDKKKVEEQLVKVFRRNTATNKNEGLKTTTFSLQPLGDIHFNTNYSAYGQRIASLATLYSLLAVAAFLLLLACINFINLSTAQASQRAKEIGIRKTMGSSRMQLIMQFLSETLLVTTIATLVSLLMTPVLLKAFSSFIPQGLVFDLHRQPYIILFLLILTLLVSFLSGVYPAMVLSGFNPVRTLKNQAFISSGNTRGAWIRKTLTVSQFVVAQFFIIGTILVSKQISYSINTDMGFRKDAILTFEMPRDTVKTHGPQLLAEINAIPEVELASTGFFSPGGEGVAFTNIKYAGKEDLKEQVQLRWGDSNFLKLYQVKIIAGRNVQKVDSFQELLINETYAKLLGFQHPLDALNKHLDFQGKKMPIVGVMKDFHEQSLHGVIGPVVFAGGNGNFFHILLKPKGADGQVWQHAIAKIQKAFSQIYPDNDFSYEFVDANIARMYKSEEDTSSLLLWSTALTIFISCLGLLGMVIYVTNSRTKEIGVRKVLGATVTNIVMVLSKDFVKLVLIAFLIAAPAAWWAIHKWLEGFAYKTAVSWWVFALSGFILIFFAVITLGIQTIRAARANPVDSLKTE